MNPPLVRWGLHAAHAITSLALIATGLLIQWPDLRARIVGGYGRQILSVHDWVGVAFIAAPALALALAGRPLVRDLRRRLGPPEGLTWTKIHLVATLAVTALLGLSGVLLWVNELPRTVENGALEVHSILSWVVLASIPVHLVAARRKIVDVVAVLLRLREPPRLGFPLEDEEDA
jgi:cytochrome b subunit of formate dehydrogenase